MLLEAFWHDRVDILLSYVLCCVINIPEETFPRREVGSFEQCVFQNALDTSECLDHVSSVVVEIPQLAVMPLVCPPERILLQNLASQ